MTIFHATAVAFHQAGQHPYHTEHLGFGTSREQMEKALRKKTRTIAGNGWHFVVVEELGEGVPSPLKKSQWYKIAHDSLEKCTAPNKAAGINFTSSPIS
jgi:superoxide dismutase